MQSLLLVLESIGGTLAVVYAGAFVRGRRRNPALNLVEPVFCHVLAPDERIRCLEDPFHYGWHRNGGMTWFGSVWARDVVVPPKEQPSGSEREPLKFIVGAFGTRRPE